MRAGALGSAKGAEPTAGDHTIVSYIHAPTKPFRTTCIADHIHQISDARMQALRGPLKPIATPPPCSPPKLRTLAPAERVAKEERPRQGKASRRREAWSEEEHRLFVEALGLYNRNWKEVAAHVGSKTVVQVRALPRKRFPPAL